MSTLDINNICEQYDLAIYNEKCDEYFALNPLDTKGFYTGGMNWEY